MGEVDTERPSRTVTQRIGGYVRAGASYALFAVGVGLLGSFFAPYLGFAELAWHGAVLPTVAAPPPNDFRSPIDVAPLLVGVFVSSLAVWLR